MHFESPWAFLLLLAVPALMWLGRAGRKGGSIRFSSTRNASRTGRSLRLRLAFVPSALRALGLVLLIVALARPIREHVEQQQLPAVVLALQDISASVAADTSEADQLWSRHQPAAPLRGLRKRAVRPGRPAGGLLPEVR